MLLTVCSIYRSHTLGQNYDLFIPDQSVSAAGAQNLSFSITDKGIVARIDRSYIYDDYWIWGFPDLSPAIDWSLVIHDTSDAFACFNKGQNSFFTDPSVPLGYADGYLTDYLIRQARQLALPWLLSNLAQDIDSVEQNEVLDPMTGQEYTALSHKEIDLALIVNTTSGLPYAIRSTEDHIIYGASTSDLVLSAWSDVKVGTNTVLLPHRLQTVYNSESVLEDFVLDSISINTEFPAAFFEADPPSKDAFGQPSKPSKPAQSSEYPMSEVHESFESGLWSGPFGEIFDTSDVVVTHPFPDQKQIMVVYVGYPDYVQMLVEFEDGLLITDAPPHRSEIIVDWVKNNMNGKRITHVVPSHHHRDHAGGVNDYIDAGATLVVPEIAAELYNLTGKVASMITYTEERPFVWKDSNVEFRSYWKEGNPHARDWSFGVAASVDPSHDEDFAIFCADVIIPGTDARNWDTGVATTFIKDLIDAGVPQSAHLVGAHGTTQDGKSTSDSLLNVSKIAGIDYPALSAEDWSNNS